MHRGRAAQSTASEPAESVESVITRGAKIRGRIGGEGDLRVEGQVEGDVRIHGQLTIDEGGAVHGEVEATAVVIDGALEGDVATRAPVTIRAGAKVTGNLGGEVVLEEGASFRGRIDADFDMPAELGGPSGKPAGRGR